MQLDADRYVDDIADDTGVADDDEDADDDEVGRRCLARC